ncbi:MAG TPA: hypothetical protein VLI39_12485 [Sedimentisphaerales bacterium]|nr:hypothetical protein [Sedimentisphaerales bacterium]
MASERESRSPLTSFLFPHIFRSFRMAIQPSCLILAFAALTVICLTGWLMDLSRTVVVSTENQVTLPGRIPGRWPQGGVSELQAYLCSPAQCESLINSPSSSHTKTGVFNVLAGFAGAEFQTLTTALLSLDIRPFVTSLVNSIQRSARAVVWAFAYHTLYSLVFFAVALVALSAAGGAICRISALQFARGTHPGLTKACRFSRRRLASLVAAPIGPLIMAFLLGLPIILLGVIGNIPVAGELLAGLLLPLAFVLAPFIAVVLIGEAAGLGLMFPAVAYEDSDFFDAVGRSFSSVYAQPWRLGFYTLLATIYGALCHLFVRLFAWVLLWVTGWFLQLGLSDGKFLTLWPTQDAAGLEGMGTAPGTWSLCIGAFLVRLWTLGIAGLTVAFLISFYFTANTIIYALLRRHVDGTEIEEVYETCEQGSGEGTGRASMTAAGPEPTDTTSE